MGYLNEDGLARYDGLIKNWVTFKSGTVDGIDPLLNWQKTETAGTVSFYPLPATPIDPVVNFLFTESDPASGTKGPDNPSTITGVFSITVTRCETVGVDETTYTVNLGGTYYGGSVDLSTGLMTVTHIMYDIGQAVTAYASGARLFLFDGEQSSRPQDALCESFNFHNVGLADLQNGDFRYQTGGSGGGPEGKTRWVFKAVDYTTLESFKSAFAGRKLVYPLATPYTLQLAPTQIYSLSQPDPYTPRINTVYSDQESVQVGYPKSPLATSTELINAIVSLGGNV